MGVAKCSSAGFLRTTKYGNNWQMKSLAELKPMYETIMEFLKNTEYGEFLALKELFGEDVAIWVAMNGGIKVPAFISKKRQEG
jgi:hypothetical protein